MRDRIARQRVTDPHRAANAERVGPRREKAGVFNRADGWSVATLTEAGKIGSDWRPSSLEKRPSEVDEVLARHAEAMEKDDVA